MRLSLIIFILFSFTAFGQENPWEQKNKENPWETTEQNEETTESEKKVDETDSTSTNATVTTTSYAATSHTTKEAATLYAKNAKDEYKAGKGFALGFATGLLAPGYGLVANLAYTLHDSKDEVRIIEEIEIDSSYTTSDSLFIVKECENKMKSKKFFTSLGGSVAGSFTTLAIIIGLSAF